MNSTRMTLGAALLSALSLSACAPAAYTGTSRSAVTLPGTVESGPGLHAELVAVTAPAAAVSASAAHTTAAPTTTVLITTVPTTTAPAGNSPAAPVSAPTVAAPLLSAEGRPVTMALTPTFAEQPGDVFPNLDEVGAYGLWLLNADRSRAHYAAPAGSAKAVRQPTNVVLIDKAAATPEAASTRMTAALSAAGYTAQAASGHAAHQAFVAGEYRPESQTYTRAGERLHLFGPWKTKGGLVFTAAIAAEGPGGTFQNFMVAREALADALNGKTAFRKKGYVDLLAKVETPTETTADHDGCAVILVARE